MYTIAFENRRTGVITVYEAFRYEYRANAQIMADELNRLYGKSGLHHWAEKG